MPYIAIDQDNYVTAISDHFFVSPGHTVQSIFCSSEEARKMVGNKLSPPFLQEPPAKDISELRVAVICNWHTKCGISTYSKFLIDSMRSKVKEIRIFSEQAVIQTAEDGPEVVRCWKRGECLVPMTKQLLQWKPDFVLIQHEFGIFPNLFYFMQMMQLLENIPYAVTLHSVYEHLDKIVYTNAIKNIIVHSKEGKGILLKHGYHDETISVIPHGCVHFDGVQELWNLCQNPYTIMQFGFGFAYKGVERTLDALHHLKMTDPKFANIFYFYLISDNDYNSRQHIQYYNQLKEKVAELDLEHNVALVRKYQSEHMINLYLRMAKLAIFPYVNNPQNMVYGASGAIRIAMANNCPVIASDCHLFDDLQGVVPRPGGCLDLAAEIDKVFSNHLYKQQIVNRGKELIRENSWENTSNRYLSLIRKLCA